MIPRCCTPARAAFTSRSTDDRTSGAINGIFEPSGCTDGNTTVHPERVCAAGGGNGCYAEIRITSAALQAQSQHSCAGRWAHPDGTGSTVAAARAAQALILAALINPLDAALRAPLEA